MTRKSPMTRAGLSDLLDQLLRGWQLLSQGHPEPLDEIRQLHGRLWVQVVEALCSGLEEMEIQRLDISALPAAMTHALPGELTSLELSGSFAELPRSNDGATDRLTVHLQSPIGKASSLGVDVDLREEGPLQSGVVADHLRRAGGKVDLRGWVAVVLPRWVLAEGSRLEKTRRRLAGRGQLRAVVELPEVGPTLGLLAVVLLGPVRRDGTVTFARPYRVSERDRDAEVVWRTAEVMNRDIASKARWVPDDFRRTGAIEKLCEFCEGLGVPSSALGALTSGPAPVGQHSEVDPDWLAAILDQPAWRHAVRVEPRAADAIPVPLPPLAVQRDWTRRIAGDRIELSELASLLEGTPENEPRLDTLFASFEQLFKRSKEQGRLSRVDRVFGWLVGQFKEEAEGTRMPTAIEGLGRVFPLVAEALLDAETVGGEPIAIARLSAAIAHLDAEVQQGRVGRALARGFAKPLVDLRDAMVGTPSLAFTVEEASWSPETKSADLKISVENEGRYPLFGLRFEFRVVEPERDCGEFCYTTFPVIKADEEVGAGMDFGGLDELPSRVEVSWTGRDLLGDHVSGEIVLAVDADEEADPVEGLKELLGSRSWEQLESMVGGDEDFDEIVPILIAARKGDRQEVERLLVSDLEDCSADTAAAKAAFALLLGVMQPAEDILRTTWERLLDGDLALALGRVLLLRGQPAQADAFLARALTESYSEAHGVRAWLHARAGREGAAREELRGIELDADLRLASLPVWLELGDRERFLSDRSTALAEETDPMTLAWPVFDLVRAGYLSEARALWELADDDEDPAINWLHRLGTARLAWLQGEEEESERVLRDLFGDDHGFTFSDGDPPTALPPSPYAPGRALSTDEGFYGRERELDQLVAMCSDATGGRVALLEGARRTGKTSILNQVQRRLAALDQPPLVARVDLQVLAGQLDASSLWQELGRGLRRAAGVRSRVIRTLPPTSTRVDFEGELEERLESQEWSTVVLLIDEFEHLEAALKQEKLAPSTLGELRHLAQSQPVHIVLAGAHELFRSERAYRSPLFGMGVTIQVTGLDEASARRLVEEPSQGSLSWTREAIDRVLELSNREPFFVQHVCNAVWENRRRRPRTRSVGLREVEQAVPDVLVSARAHLDQQIDAFDNPIERALLQRVAAAPALDPRPVSVERVLEDTRERVSAPHDAVRASLDSMVDFGLLARKGDGVRLNLALLHYRVAERFPWRRP